jgi:ribonuclease G
MNRLVITRIEYNQNQFIAYILLDENRNFLDLQVFEPEEKTLLDNIYVGYVEKVVPNIQAAFVRIAEGQKCYLPFEEIKSPIFSKKQSEHKQICEGDELLVQVTRDAVKTKDPVVSTKLTVHGRYSLMTTDNTALGVSKKIPETRAAELLTLAKTLCDNDSGRWYGLLFRTNAAGATEEELTEDIHFLQQKIEHIRTTGIHNRSCTLLDRNLPGYLSRLKAQNTESIDCIYTDQRDLYEEIATFLPHLKDSGLLRYYDDSAVSLSTLYHLRGNLEQLLGTKVWLPSGANIIIETLETMTVIDVNSGRNQSRKPEILFEINREAACEIARQLRLRNISGMIIVDFINLKSKDQQTRLIQCIRQELKKDTVPAQFVDITRLGLVEITRKKTYKSIHEILKNSILF